MFYVGSKDTDVVSSSPDTSPSDSDSSSCISVEETINITTVKSPNTSPTSLVSQQFVTSPIPLSGALNSDSDAAMVASSGTPSKEPSLPTAVINKTAKLAAMSKKRAQRWLRRSVGSSGALTSFSPSMMSGAADEHGGFKGKAKKVSISAPLELTGTSNATLVAVLMGETTAPLATPSGAGLEQQRGLSSSDENSTAATPASPRIYQKGKNANLTALQKRKISQTRNRKLGNSMTPSSSSASSMALAPVTAEVRRKHSSMPIFTAAATAGLAGVTFESPDEQYDIIDGAVVKRGDVTDRHRKICMDCKCSRDAHDACHQDWVNVRDRVGFKTDSANSTKDQAAQLGYAWVPEGLSPKQVETYMSLLPKEKVPKLGTDGERYRDHQLMVQLPKQDFAAGCCHHLGPEHRRSYDEFVLARNDIAFNIAVVQPNIPEDSECQECLRVINKGSMTVITPNYSESIYRHPSCFVCCVCKELLVDLAYCSYEDNIYCERHYADQLKPRCAACEELIFSGEYTKAMSKDWHSTHFCCWNCDESLTGQRYVLRDDHPYCIKCYEDRFSNNCEECKKTIGIESKDLSYKDRHWHEACFLCAKCRVSLVDKQFGSKFEKIYCGNCYDAQFASRCDGCGDVFKAGMKKMEYKTRQWHEKCFCCIVCHSPIGTKSFIPRDQEIYCTGCYEETFATRCIKCNKIITSGGVTYKNEPWHRECFTCTNCTKSLAGERFTSKNEKPYCAECFGELFAKRCTSCAKPITGIGGTRYISFEDRHWHNDCFTCASCKSSLVGKGFITDGEDILCPDCAKQKLM